MGTGLTALLSGNRSEPSQDMAAAFQSFHERNVTTSEVIGSTFDRAVDTTAGRELGDTVTIHQEENRLQPYPYISPSGRAMGVQPEPRTFTPYTEEDYKNSKYYRAGVPYEEGMTERVAEIRARRDDNKRLNDYVMQRSTGWQTALGFGSAIGAELIDPVNIVLGFTPIPFASTAVGIKMAAKAAKYGKVVERAGKGFVAGAYGNALIEPILLSTADTLHEDYTISDSMFNILFGGFVGSALHVGVGKLADRADAKIARELDDIRLRDGDHMTLDQHLRATEIASMQSTVGKSVDTSKYVDAALRTNRALERERAIARGERPAKVDATGTGGLLAAPEAPRFDLGEISGGRYKSYSPIRQGDRAWIEGVNKELQDSNSGDLTFIEVDGQGSTPQVIANKGDTPEWFRQANKEIKELQREVKRLKKKGADTDPVGSTLTRKDVDRVTRKMLAGEPLGKAEGRIAEIIHGQARDMRLENVNQMLDYRAQRDISVADARALEDEAYENLMRDGYLHGADIEARYSDYMEYSNRVNDEVEGAPVTMSRADIDAEIESLQKDFDNMREQDYLDADDELEISTIDREVQYFEDIGDTFDLLGTCLTKGGA